MNKKIIVKKSDAIKFFSRAFISKKLGISSQAITQWEEVIPEKSAWPLFYLSNNKLKAKIKLTF